VTGTLLLIIHPFLPLAEPVSRPLFVVFFTGLNYQPCPSFFWVYSVLRFFILMLVDLNGTLLLSTFRYLCTHNQFE